MVLDAVFCRLLAVRLVATLTSSVVSCSGVGAVLLSARSEEDAIVEGGVGVHFPQIGAAASYLAFRLNELQIYVHYNNILSKVR